MEEDRGGSHRLHPSFSKPRQRGKLSLTVKTRFQYVPSHKRLISGFWAEDGSNGYACLP